MANHKQRLEPAATVVEMLGGCSAVARELKTSRQNVFKWTSPSEVGGRGGLIPTWYLAPLLDLAERKGVPLTAEMLIRGPKSRSSRGR